MTSDLDLLLGQFAREKSQDAFTALVNRHVDLVYSAALRQVRSPQLAEEIAQSVFADLARDAGKLTGGSDASSQNALTPWLYAVTRRTAIDMIRKESRRQLREQIAMEMNNMNATCDELTQIEPLLDDAMAALDETDRSAILLRYFENKNLREVGEALGTNDDAAQKRVSRAVERLREFFSKRNVTIGAGGLGVVISANAVQAAPAGLAATISTAAVLTGTAVHTSTIIAATKTIAMTTLQKTFVAAALTAAIGTGIFEAHQASHLREQNQMLQQQEASLAAQIQELQRERDDAINQLAGLLAENARLKSNSNENELLKLRGEVAQLKTAEDQKENDPLVLAANAWLDRVKQLKQIVKENPNKGTPEFELLSEKDWLSVAMNAKFDTDKDIRNTLALLRHRAEADFANQISRALQKFMKDNNAQFPSDFSQLQPCFENPVSDAILSRWQVLPQSTLPSYPNMGGDFVITEKAPIDPNLDFRFIIGPDGFSNNSYLNPDLETLEPAIKAFARANNGKQPTEFSQIQPFLTTSEQETAFQKLIQARDAGASLLYR
jgi:RNA polymerase sigma factor (sigma-70 family)